MTGFAEAVRRLRAEAGHPSARAFYRTTGGRGFFGCTYKAYLNIEAGRSVPQPRLALRIAAGLGLPERRGGAKGFVTAYLRSAVGHGELAGFLVRALSPGRAVAGEGELFQKASESSFAEQTMPLNQDQAELLLRDSGTYWCFTWLSNDYGHWEEAELARRLPLSPARTRRALQALAKAGLASRDREKRWFCPHTGKIFQYPRDQFFVPRSLEKLKAHWDWAAVRRGERLLDRGLVLAASEAALRDSFPALAQASYGAHLYARREGGKDTAVFVVDVAVRKVLDL